MRTVLVVLVLLAAAMMTPARADAFRLSSPDFVDGGAIPAKCSLHGGNIAPDLVITGVPKGTQMLVLIMDDPDAPSGLWTHWVVWNITKGTSSLPGGRLPAEAKEGRNSFGNVRYDGPSPPSGTHHYYFRLYAVKWTRDLKKLAEGANRAEVEAALGSMEYEARYFNVIAHVQLVGTFTAIP